MVGLEVSLGLYRGIQKTGRAMVMQFDISYEAWCSSILIYLL